MKSCQVSWLQHITTYVLSTTRYGPILLTSPKTGNILSTLLSSLIAFFMRYFKPKANHFPENKGISYIQLKSKIVILHASIAHLLLFGSGWVPPVVHVGEALNSTFALPVLWCFMLVIFTAWSWQEPLSGPDGMNGKQIKLVVVFYFSTTNLTNFP